MIGGSRRWGYVLPIGRVFGRNNTVVGVFDESSVCRDVLAKMAVWTSLTSTRVQFCTASTRTRGPHGHHLVAASFAQSPSGLHLVPTAIVRTSPSLQDHRPELTHGLGRTRIPCSVHRSVAIDALLFIPHCVLSHHVYACMQGGLPPACGYKFPLVRDFISRSLARFLVMSILCS